MYFKRTYWKWNRNLDAEKFNLGDKVSAIDKKENLLFQSIDEIDSSFVYIPKKWRKIEICLNEKNIIIKKRFLRGAKIGEFLIRKEFYKIIYPELKEFLIECDKKTSGEILEIVFGDAWLGIAILKQKNNDFSK